MAGFNCGGICDSHLSWRGVDKVGDRSDDDDGVQLRGAFVIHTYGDDVWTRLATALSGDDGGVQLWRAYMWHGDMAGWYTVDINAFEVCVEPNE